MRIGRRELLRAGAVLGAAALTGCTTRFDGTPVPATSLPGKVRETIRLGAVEYRPYAFPDGGGVTGEVVEVARVIAERLGSSLTVELLPRERLLPAIDAGDLDVVGGLSIRAANCASLDFTVPDHVSLTALVVPQGNPKGITTFTEVVSTGARLAVVADSLEVTAAKEVGVRGIQVYPSGDELLRAVLTGAADCGAYDDITLRDLMTRVAGLQLRPSFEPAGGAPRYGFGFRKGRDRELRTAFDEVLGRLHESGEWLAVTSRFGFTERNIPDEESAGEACER